MLGDAAGGPGGQAQAPARAEPLLQPTVSWPADMTYRRRYLVTVDLALVTEDGSPAAWPLDGEEEYAYTCLLDGGGAFDLWPVHDASVVLHRFGGSYGPAEFVVTPSEPKSGSRSIWLTVLNQWGVSAGDYELTVETHVLPKDQPTLTDGPVEVAASVTPSSELPGAPGDDPAGNLDPAAARELAEVLAAGDQVTVDIPYTEASGTREAPPGPDTEPPTIGVKNGAMPAAPTTPDLPGTDGDGGNAGGAAATRQDPGRAPQPPRDTRRTVRRLAEYYNVAGLRRSRSGRLRADLVPLFAPGATRGDRVTFTAYCSPSDSHGTVFAVVAQPPDGSDRMPELRSIQSAKVPPGVYRVTAELLHPGPGHVQFHGLPAPPREDPRRWQEITATVPQRLPAGAGPAHVIIALEISAPDDHTASERLDAARRFILHVAAEAADFVCYSVIAYGPHSIHLGNRYYPEVPSERLAWAVTADDALAELDRLSRRGNVPFGYERAAQLECVLADLDADLTGHEGRPVIVTIGDRPPHPPRLDPVTSIIPCHHRTDWAVPMTRLPSRHAGIRFGAIRDTGHNTGPDELWRLLGADAATAGDFYPPGFAQSLGLTPGAARPAAPPIALPLFADWNVPGEISQVTPAEHAEPAEHTE